MYYLPIIIGGALGALLAICFIWSYARWMLGYGSYGDYLRSPRWRQLREQALQRDGRRCRLCNYPYNLEVHHRRYAGRWGNETVDDLTTLCGPCHEMFTRTRSALVTSDDGWPRLPRPWPKPPKPPVRL